MIGIRGNFSLILRTIFAVSAPPLTFNISAPASILLCISVNSDTIVTTTGMSIESFTYLIVSSGAGELRIAPIAPWNSACRAIFADLFPCVNPPPTPHKTGISETDSIAWVIAGWGVNGYTAITASALVFFIIATSVVKINDFSLFPKILIPAALDIILWIDT